MTFALPPTGALPCGCGAVLMTPTPRPFRSAPPEHSHLGKQRTVPFIWKQHVRSPSHPWTGDHVSRSQSVGIISAPTQISQNCSRWVSGVRPAGPGQMAVYQVCVNRASLSASLCLSLTRRLKQRRQTTPAPTALVRTCVVLSVWVNTAGQTVPLRALHPPPTHPPISPNLEKKQTAELERENVMR